MFELLAMSARHPATVNLSLEEFSRHGGLTGQHKDGWGIGWYDQSDIRLIKEIHPVASSACVRFLRTNPFSSSLVVSHINTEWKTHARVGHEPLATPSRRRFGCCTCLLSSSAGPVAWRISM